MNIGVDLAIVTGMHRAGTSAIARALAVLGFDLGPRLMSADVRMNARGFFEDIDIVALDDALLAQHGADWKSVALLADVDFAGASCAEPAQRARDLLAARLAPTGRYACKDPRLPRLLPFWRRVIVDLGLADGYVIAVRHPAAVIASLTARDDLDPRRSAWLWLVHLACSLVYTTGRPRVVVDYDRLLASPERELARIAAAFGLAVPAGDSAALAEFRDRFLTTDLRHAHVASDVVDPDWPPLVAPAHALAQRLAALPGAIDADADPEIAALWARLREFAPLLAYAGTVEGSADQLPWTQASLDAARTYVTDLEAHLAAKDADLVALRAHAQASTEAAATYAASLRAALTHAEAELTAARLALGALGRTRTGRGVLRWLARRRPPGR